MGVSASAVAAIGKVIPEGDYATIVFQRVLRHPPEAVWSAITDPEELKEWMMCSWARIDGRVGGRIEMMAGPPQYHSGGAILRWEPPQVLEYEWKVAPVPEMPRGEDAIFRWELMRQGDSTLLTVTYRRLTKASAGGFAPGLQAFLERLEAQLDGSPLPDWMDRFMALRPFYPSWKG